MEHYKRSPFNPCPITKLAVTLFLAVTLMYYVHDVFNVAIVLVICLMFALNGRLLTALKTIIFYTVLWLICSFRYDSGGSFLWMILMIPMMMKIFFLPVLAGKFLVETSDVSSMIVSLEKIHIPRVIVIPIAVMFRYFPAFKDDKRNIKSAMKMRGINFKNPIKYLEYVSVPLLISAVNISDDISKAAETKCISDPCKKTRYNEVRMGFVDFVYVALILGIFIVGQIFTSNVSMWT